MAEFMLSLSTNPYDPFGQYELWLNFDHREGFDTAGLLARIVGSNDELPDVLREAEIEAAIDSIVDNPSFKGLYKKVSRSMG